MKKFVLTLALVALTLVFLNATYLADGYKVGDTVSQKVAANKMKNVDGKMISLSDYSSKKGLIVIFSCNHCPFVKANEERMVALNNKYASKGYPVVAINPNSKTHPDDTFAMMQDRAKEKGFTFDYVTDDNQYMAKEFGATKTPQVYILKNESGKMKVSYIGAIDDNTRDASKVNAKYVEGALDNLLKGKAISQKETKAVGCTIKWKEQ